MAAIFETATLPINELNQYFVHKFMCERFLKLIQASVSQTHKRTNIFHYPQVRGYCWLRLLIQFISQNTNQLSNLELLLSLKGSIFNRICSGKLLVESWRSREGSRVQSWELRTTDEATWTLSLQLSITAHSSRVDSEIYHLIITPFTKLSVSQKYSSWYLN